MTTDVTSAARKHSISVVVNEDGRVQRITCVPCGLLRDVTTQSADDDDDEKTGNEPETQYSKVRQLSAKGC